jgi:hypothetical protein
LAPGERKVRQKLDHLAFPNLSGRWYSDTIKGTEMALVFLWVVGGGDKEIDGS